MALPAPNGAVPAPPPPNPMMQMSSTNSFQPPPSVQKRRWMSWITCSRSLSCLWSSSDSDDGFPKNMACLCARVVILSRDHAQLMIGFLCGVFVGLRAFWIITSHAVKAGSDDASEDLKSKTPTVALGFTLTFLEVVAAEICLLVCLARFEDIDVVQQLEREVKELVEQNKHVENQREKMREFWTSAQNLTELWLYRTVPRLDMLKEMHSQLEEASQTDLLMHISGANQCVEDLEAKLGDIQAWRNDDGLKTEAKIKTEHKKEFSKAINNLCQVSDFKEMLNKLTDVTENHMSNLHPLALPPGNDNQTV